MAGPGVTIDLDKIAENARAVVSLCADHGVAVTGVTKVTCGLPQVAKALLHGGVADIGESRLENVHRLRAGGITSPVMLLRIPQVSAADEIVTSVDTSLNSELSAIRALSRAAEQHGIVHRIILMVDLGDLREGFWPDDLLPAVREVVDLPGIRIQGIGTNLTCYGGVIPTQQNMGQLADWAHRIEDTFRIPVETISGGNSSSLPLLASGRMPKAINHLRIGEAILLGRETIHRTCWPATVQDAFTLSAEIIELKRKPSVPIGETGQDAFGRTPVFVNRGEMLRGILNVGREDVDVEGIVPADSGVTIVGASSDHLIIDVTHRREPAALGDEVVFSLSYSALLSAMTSGYVEKRPVGGERFAPGRERILFVGDDPVLGAPDDWEDLERLGYRDRRFLPAFDPDELANLGFQPGDECIVAAGREPLFRPLYRLYASAGDPPGVVWFSPSADDLLGSPEELPVSAENLVLLCLQDAQEVAADIIRRLRIETFTMEDVDLLGIREATCRALRRAASGARGAYVRFNPSVAIGGGDGLTHRETHLAMETIAASGLLRALDLSGTGHRARRERETIRTFIRSALGKRILGR